jgi:DNA-binding NarL/FixJ family response regulator
MIRVIVADDHPIVRAGIVHLLTDSDDFDVIGEAATGTEAVRLAEALSPQLILMDLRMPELDGDAATAQIRAAHPEIKVVILTTYDTDGQILAAIEAGASGYLLKAAPQQELLAGLRSVMRGDVALAPSIAATLVGRIAEPRVSLSPRETEILTLVADGLSNPEIAARLHLGEATVKTHLIHAFEKLGVSDRTRAVVVALDLGILRRDRSPGR